MRIVLFGPQSSGKGTQAKILKEKLTLPHISTGDIFRDNIARGTELGKKVKAILDAGTLVPDKITDEIVKRRLSGEDCKEGFILDGYPRNIAQAEALEKFSKVDVAVEIHIADAEAVKRLSNRRFCPKCGIIYNLYTMPKPKNPKVCDHDGAALYQRDDDKPDAIKKRLEIYHQETEPLLEFYKKRGILKKVKGNQAIRKVTAGILASLK